MARPRRYPTGFPPGSTIPHGGWRGARQPQEPSTIATRLWLLCAGASVAMRGAAFPHPDDPLDAAFAGGGRGMPSLPRRARVVSAPERTARDTAAMLGLDASIEPALADVDHGRWAGRPFDAVDRGALAAWIAAPHLGAPDGETLSDVAARIAAWLDGARAQGGVVVAITHAAVIRAALAAILDVDPKATLVMDVAPLSVMRLSHHDRWRLQELRRS